MTTTHPVDADEIIERLDRIILDAVPGVTKVSKYGGTLYTLAPDEKEGQFCGVFAHARHVQLSFSRGDLLDDPAGMLAGNGKRRRHMNFAAADHVPDEDVRTLVRQAARR